MGLSMMVTPVTAGPANVKVIPTWAAALIVGMIIIVVGGFFAKSGLGMLSLRTLTPDRTAESLQKDARMVREHT